MSIVKIFRDAAANVETFESIMELTPTNNNKRIGVLGNYNGHVGNF